MAGSIDLVEGTEPTSIPRPVEGVDARTLPIGPEEAFVLSRIDGFTSEADIVSATGLHPDRVRSALQVLERLGAVRFEASRVTVSARPSAALRQSSAGLKLRAAIETRADPATLHHPAAALYDPAELDEQVDLDLPKKRRVLDLYYRLDTLTHYELLGLDPSVDKKAIKAAYYEVVSTFHPDRYFGKELGSFKAKLEKVFARLTLAHDVLTRTQGRAEYDAYLETQRKNRDLERLLTDDATQEAELSRARRRIEEEARIIERAEITATRAPTVPPAPPLPRLSSGPPLDPEARKRALARKLGRGHVPTSPSQPVVQPTAEEMRERVGQDLKRRYDQRVQQARWEQIQRYIEVADQAILEKKAVSATNALRIAALLAPEDARLAERLAEVQEIANAELADSYVEQAQYEERNGQFEEAARSYARAVSGRDSPRLHERLAHCLVESRGDLRVASEHAKKAVSLAPNEASYRTTLGRVYLAAGMKQSALGEFERAAALAPWDGSIKEWLKRARRGDV